MSLHRCARVMVSAFGLLLTVSCGGNEGSPEVTRAVGPDGRVTLTYAGRGEMVEDTLVSDLRIGRIDGGGPESFAEIRGLEVGEDGTIFVFDHQASEIRLFGPDGAYIRTIGSKGSGPREIQEANGLARGPDGTLWVNDYRRRTLVGFSESGEEVGRHPALVNGYGYVWTGTVDSTGVLGEQWSHSVGESQFDITATGPVESDYRLYHKTFDPLTQVYDSVEIGVATSIVYRAAMDRGRQIVMGIPFSGGLLAAVDRGGGIWAARSGTYRVVKLGTAGDTLLVIDLPTEPLPVTDADLESWRETFPDAFGELPAVQAALEELLPEEKPVLSVLHTDAEGRVWVGRTVPGGEAPLFDVFSAGGELLASVRTFPGTFSSIRPKVVGDRYYAVVQDELGVSYVMAAPLPESLRE